MFGMWDVGCSGCGMLEVWDVWDVVCSTCGMLGMWDIADAGCSGCGVFEMWDVRNVGCSGCWMFWNLRYRMFAGIWDVDLQNAENIYVLYWECKIAVLLIQEGECGEMGKMWYFICGFI